jgi:hypothetical protein
MVEFRRAVEEHDETGVIKRKFGSFLSTFCKEVESGLASRHSLDVFAIALSLRTCAPNVVAMPGFLDIAWKHLSQLALSGLLDCV